MSFEPTATLVHASSARMAEVRDGEAALVLTGPPYFPRAMEDGLAAGGPTLEREETLARAISAFALSLRPIFDECVRVLARDGACVLQTRDVRVGSRLVAVESTHRMLLEAAGLVLYSRQAWWPSNPAPKRTGEIERAAGGGRPRAPDPEVFLTFRRPGAASVAPAERADAALLSEILARTPRGRLKRPHRHQAPVPMIEAIVRTWSAPGDLIVDPFAGGGTTLATAVQLGRRAIGYEIDPDMIEGANVNIDGAAGPNAARRTAANKSPPRPSGPKP